MKVILGKVVSLLPQLEMRGADKINVLSQCPHA